MKGVNESEAQLHLPGRAAGRQLCESFSRAVGFRRHHNCLGLGGDPPSLFGRFRHRRPEMLPLHQEDGKQGRVVVGHGVVKRQTE